MADPSDPPHKTRQPLPDGWIRTPLPPPSRDSSTPGTWFERTGEPAPPRTRSEPATTEGPQFARIVLWTGVALALFFGVLVVVI